VLCWNFEGFQIFPPTFLSTVYIFNSPLYYITINYWGNYWLYFLKILSYHFYIYLHVYTLFGPPNKEVLPSFFPNLKANIFTDIIHLVFTVPVKFRCLLRLHLSVKKLINPKDEVLLKKIQIGDMTCFVMCVIPHKFQRAC
jgi:hypothetical protein